MRRILSNNLLWTLHLAIRIFAISALLVLGACRMQDRQMRIWYQRAEAARKAGDTDRQMAFLLQAERGALKADDQQISGAISFSKCLIFKEFYDLDRAISEAEKARFFYSASGNSLLAHDAILEVIGLYMKMGIYPGASTWVDYLQFQDLAPDQTERLNKLSELLACLVDGDVLTAVDLVAESGVSDSFCEEMFFQELLGKERASAGNPETAQAVFFKRDQKLKEAASREAKMFAISAELIQQRREKVFRQGVFVASVLALLLLGFILWAHRRNAKNRREAIRLQGEVADQIQQAETARQEARAAREEARRLEILLSESSLSGDIRKWVAERIETLNRISARILIPEGETHRRQCVEELLHKDNPEVFAGELYQQFAFAHPAMATYLQSRDLSFREQLVCALLCLGLKGKDIAGFLQLSGQRCYNIQNEIRKKLGFQDQRKNLQTLLAEKMAELG